jgi:hypothetical protein
MHPANRVSVKESQEVYCRFVVAALGRPLFTKKEYGMVMACWRDAVRIDHCATAIRAARAVDNIAKGV